MKTSAGLLLYRSTGSGAVEVLLVHPGGPFWSGKDSAAWSIPKGEFAAPEDAQAAAIREFTEELGSPPPPPQHGLDDLDLGVVKQSSSKTVTVFARCADFDTDRITSNLIEIDWPPRSGRRLQIPEIDRARWCPVDEGREKLVRGQVPFLDRLLERLDTVQYPLTATAKPETR